MDNWKTFVDYEMEIVNEETGECTYKIIGKQRAQREYRILRNETQIIIDHDRKVKRIIHRCRKHEQLRIFEG